MNKEEAKQNVEKAINPKTGIPYYSNPDGDKFQQNLDKWVEFISWARWNPDLFLDLITPETGGIRLDLDQRVFIRVLVRFASVYGVFPRGYGKCVSGDTLILTNEGVKEIGSYFNYQDDNVETYIIPKQMTVSNRHKQMENVIAGVYSGYKDTKKIYTEEGIEIEPSLNHPVLVMTTDGNIDWKRTEDLHVGDYLITSRGDNVWGSRTKLTFDMHSWLNSFGGDSKWKIEKNKCNTPTELTEDLALIIGYLLGDGCLTRDNIILFTSKDQDMVERYHSFMNNVIGVEVKQRKTGIDYVVNGKYVREYFRQLGLSQSDAFTKVIPNIILEAPKKYVVKCLQGLFDTDGGVESRAVSFCTASEKMSKQVQTLLLNLGIISNRRTKISKQYQTKSYIITITGSNILKFRDEIGFSCQRKQELLEQRCKEYQGRTIKDIIPNQQSKIREFYESIGENVNKSSHPLYQVVNKGGLFTYKKLNQMLNHERFHEAKHCEHFKSLQCENYFYSKIKTIKDSKAHVYDLSLDNTHSFVSNGLVSHNTFTELLALYVTAILYPNINLSMSAQTMQAAAGLVEEKHSEIVRFFPLIGAEIVGKPQFSKDNAEIHFTSGSTISTLANAQSSKGKRRHRLMMEEAALLNDFVFSDALEPIVNVPRRTIGYNPQVDPCEMNGQIHFLTTAYFKNTEYERCLAMVKEMAELKGKIVLGSSWELACEYGRGETRSQLLAKKEKLSPTFFATNYESRWVGSSDSCIIDLNKLFNIRTLPKAELKSDGKSEYYIGVDVARSTKTNNNQTSIVVGKVKRDKKDKVNHIQIVNIVNLPNGTNFTGQAIAVKRLQKLYKAVTVVIDINGLGVGLLDEIMKLHIDPITGEELIAFDTINTEHESDEAETLKCVWALQAQGLNTDIIVNFMNLVENGTLQLLEKVDQNVVANSDQDFLKSTVLPHVQTELFIEEVANLSLEQLNGGKLTVKRNSKSIDKDRYSALVYMIWYIMTYENKAKEEEEEFNIASFYCFSSPKIR